MYEALIECWDKTMGEMINCHYEYFKMGNFFV